MMSYTRQSVDTTLEEDLSSLSLQSEGSPHRADPPQPFNPFQEYLSSQQDQVESLIRDHVRPYLNSRRKMSRLSADHPYFQPARDLWEREGWDGEGLSNYIALLCGILDFPAILLLNPSGLDHLLWDDMIRQSPTLSWLQQILESFGFTLRDIIIIDAFPLLTDRKMDSMGSEEKLRLTNEVFNLTVNFLRHFKPPVIISCQCATKSSHHRWGIVDNPLAAPLCSSVNRARHREVAMMSVDTHVIHVVQGFHPMYIVYEEDPEMRSDHDQVLRSILKSVYQPCADWSARRRRECEEDLHTAAEEVRNTMRAFLSSVKKYRRTQRQASTFGMGPVQLGGHAMPQWAGYVRFFVATMLE